MMQYAKALARLQRCKATESMHHQIYGNGLRIINKYARITIARDNNNMEYTYHILRSNSDVQQQQTESRQQQQAAAPAEHSRAEHSSAQSAHRRQRSSSKQQQEKSKTQDNHQSQINPPNPHFQPFEYYLILSSLGVWNEL